MSMNPASRLTRKEAEVLTEFLERPDPSRQSLSYFETKGFLFAISLLAVVDPAIFMVASTRAALWFFTGLRSS